MGYYSTYTLSVLNPDMHVHDILSKISEDEFSNLFDAIDEYGNSVDTCKWYYHKNDILKLSLMFPDVIFDLYGEGEDNGDIWHEYYRAGKMQRCRAKIFFDAFDPSKLE